MGLEQSHQQSAVSISGTPATMSAAAAYNNSASTSKAGVRGIEGGSRSSTSPRPSIGSDSDIPYVSYTINRPIGESPKLQPKRAHNLLRSKSPSPSRTLGSVGSRNSSPKLIPYGTLAAMARPPRSTTGHDIVVVREFVRPAEETTDADPDLCRLQAVPAFLPIMRGALNVPTMRDPDVLDKLDYRQLNTLCQRYVIHVRLSADVVAAEQNSLASRIREIDFAISTLVGLMTERQKKYIKYAEKLGKVHEISTTLDRCQSSLKHTIEKMESLNALLSSDECLEPFVWTTG